MHQTRLDLGYVRAHFPAFTEPSLRDQAFFENACGSYACRYVVWRLSRYYKERHVQPFAPYEAAQLAREEVEDARLSMAQILGMQSDEVSFGPSSSANLHMLANAFADYLNPGDAIVVTNQDHEANATPWRRLVRRDIRILEWRMTPDGRLDPDDLAKLLDRGVRLVCFPHCSNVVGEINDVTRLTRMIRAAGALSCVDGVSYAPHQLPNVAALGADIYVFSTYKTYGPHQGVLAMRRDLRFLLPNQGLVHDEADAVRRFTPAGLDHAQVAACAGIVDYVDALHAHHFTAGRDAKGRAAEVGRLMRAHETRLLDRVLDFLEPRRDVRVLGPLAASARTPTLSLALPEPGRAVAARLARHGVMTAGGDFFAGRALAALGVAPEHGVLRVSFVHYTTDAEIDRLMRALDHEI